MVPAQKKRDTSSGQTLGDDDGHLDKPQKKRDGGRPGHNIDSPAAGVIKSGTLGLGHKIGRLWRWDRTCEKQFT